MCSEVRCFPFQPDISNSLSRLRLRARMAGVPDRPATRNRSSTSGSNARSWRARSANPCSVAVSQRSFDRLGRNEAALQHGSTQAA